MKRLYALFCFILFLIVVAVSYAAAPTVEEDGMLIFDTQGQTTSTPYTIWGIAWASSAAGQIASGNSMTIIDSRSNTTIATTVASGANDEYLQTFPNGLKVGGITVSGLTLNKGKVYINANKR